MTGPGRGHGPPAPRRVLLVVGARPNYMKAAPLLEAAPAHGLAVELVHTGQHWDPALRDELLRDLGIAEPRHRLEAGAGRTPLGQLAAMLEGLGRVVEAADPELVVVVGDVNSTLAGALAAARARPTPLPLCHVEAGLRSGDRSMPEEVNRVVVDQLADLLLVTEPSGLEHLRREGRTPRPDTAALLVGNAMIDTLLRLRPRARASRVLDDLGLAPGGYGLVTLHRPGNVDDPARLERLLAALGAVARRLPLVFPVHPRTRARLEGRALPPGLALAPPAPYLDFVRLMDAARLVLTDSGGVQEETTVLRVPCLTLRDNTERPVTVERGTNRRVGADPAAIEAAAEAALAGPPWAPDRAGPPIPGWDGRAGARIAAAIAAFLAGGPAACAALPGVDA